MEKILIERSSENVRAAGNNFGHTSISKYRCPCGGGYIEVEHDNIPGYKYIQVSLMCNNCTATHKIINEHSLNWDVVLK